MLPVARFAWGRNRHRDGKPYLPPLGQAGTLTPNQTSSPLFSAVGNVQTWKVRWLVRHSLRLSVYPLSLHRSNCKSHLLCAGQIVWPAVVFIKWPFPSKHYCKSIWKPLPGTPAIWIVQRIRPPFLPSSSLFFLPTFSFLFQCSSPFSLLTLHFSGPESACLSVWRDLPPVGNADMLLSVRGPRWRTSFPDGFCGCFASMLCDRTS